MPARAPWVAVRGAPTARADMGTTVDGASVTPSATPPGTARPVLVVGLPRAGTTWVAGVLGRAPGVRLVHEPDNAKERLAAIPATRRFGRFPVLRPGQAAPTYQLQWKAAFAETRPAVSGAVDRVLATTVRVTGAPSADELERVAQGHPSPRLRLAGTLALASRAVSVGPRATLRPVVKTVHAPLAVEWLVTSFDVQVIVVLRHPANVLASWLELGLPDRDRSLYRRPEVAHYYTERWQLPPPGPGPLAATVWQLGLLTAALEEAASRHPDWLVVTHEELCTAPAQLFARMFAHAGLAWTPETAAFLRATDRPGTGFDITRRAGEQPQRWRHRLQPGDVAELAGTLRRFPLQRWDFAHAAEIR